jgi:hypothetical protein
MGFMKRKILTVATSCILVISLSTPANSAPPISFTKVTVYKKWDAFIALNVTGKNNTSRNVRLSGYFYAKTKSGQIYGMPDFETLMLYDAYQNPCSGDSVDGNWTPKSVWTSTWCFAVPKGQTVTSVFVASNKYSTPLTSIRVSIKN